MKIAKKQLLTLIKENYVSEHHLHSNEDKIDFILKNQYLTDIPFISIEKLEGMSDQQIDHFYNEVEDALDTKPDTNDINYDVPRETDFDELEIEEPVEEEGLLNNEGNIDECGENSSDDDLYESKILTKKEIMEQFNKKQLNEEKVWKDHLQNVYSDKEEWLEYDKIYNLAKRLGYSSPIKAWYDNPLIQGSTDPADYKKVIQKQNIKETTEVSKKHPSVINQERINKETKKYTTSDRDQTFMKNMDKIVKGNDDFKTVEEPKFDKDSLKKEDILDKNAGMTAEENLEEYRIGGMGDLRYDSKPKGFDERVENEIDPVKGKRVYANSVATDLGAKINKFNKKRIENKDKAPLYNKEAQPIENVKKEDKGKKLSNVSEQKKKVVKQQDQKGTAIKDLINEETLKELEKMKHLFNYQPNDFINNKKNIIK